MDRRGNAFEAALELHFLAGGMRRRDYVAALIERLCDLIDRFLIQIRAAIQRSLAGNGIDILSLSVIGAGGNDLTNKVGLCCLKRLQNVIADVDIGELHRGGHFDDGGGRNGKHVARCINVTILHLGRGITEAVALGLNVFVGVQTSSGKDLLGQAERA